MANVAIQGGFISVGLEDSSDFWNSQDTFPDGIKVVAIAFKPSAPDDFFTVRNGGESGPVVHYFKDVLGSGGSRPFYGAVLKPYIDGAECFFYDETEARILIQYERRRGGRV